jgi:hypothetical protein
MKIKIEVNRISFDANGGHKIHYTATCDETMALHHTGSVNLGDSFVIKIGYRQPTIDILPK